MTFNALLTAAVKKYAGSSGSGDKIEFEKRKGAANVACFINGIGGSGKTAEAALKQALGRVEQVSSGAFWVGHKAGPVRRTSKHKTSKRKTSRR